MAPYSIFVVALLLPALFAVRKVLLIVKARYQLRNVPDAGDRHWLLGHVPALLKVEDPWNSMIRWCKERPPLVKVEAFGAYFVPVCSPQGLKRIFQTKQRIYDKDRDFSYRPFLSLLGTGLVTSSGSEWLHQRTLVAPALRVEVLPGLIKVSRRAVARLSQRLQAAKASHEAVDMADAFRHLTLQVIGEAVLSLPPDECDRVRISRKSSSMLSKVAW